LIFWTNFPAFKSRADLLAHAGAPGGSSADSKLSHTIGGRTFAC